MGTPARDVGDLTQSVGFLLSRVGDAIQDGFKALLAGYELRPLEFLILRLLAGEDGISQRDLCVRAGVDSGNMVAFLDHLEELGDARRGPDPADRRRRLVTITARGRRRLARIDRDREAYDERVLGALDPAQRDALADALTTLFQTLPEGGRGRPAVSG